MLELEPADAQVTLPGVDSPYRPGIELPAGEYQVIVRQVGYEESVVTVRIEAGQLTSRRIVLVEQPGSLVLELEPADAQVILPRVDSPYRPGMELPVGKYWVIVRREGYEELTVKVSIRAGERTTRSIVLRLRAPPVPRVKSFGTA